jgi:S-(hydroxymethyl)glutathione dehydrogenase / alcohol dehydrogenase
MKAAVCYEFGKPLVIEELELTPPGRGEVRVKMGATAVCHSDVHDVKGELPSPLPFVPGHECAGYVEEVGADVTSVKVGDPVIVSLLKSCGKCYYCMTGMRHLCLNRIPPTPQDSHMRNKKGQQIIQKVWIGGFAEQVVVDESMTVKIPREMPIDSASLVACGVITGFFAVVNRAKVRPFQSVAIIGAGGVGINAIQGAAFSGAYPVICVDVIEPKMKKSMEFGATHYVNAKQADAVDAVKKLTPGGRGVDFAFITVGSVAAIKQGYSMLAPRGQAIVIGLPPPTEVIPFTVFDFTRGERGITGASMGSTNLKTDVPFLLSLYQAGKIKLDELVTGRYPLSKINEAMESTVKGEGIRNVIMYK